MLCILDICLLYSFSYTSSPMMCFPKDINNPVTFLTAKDQDRWLSLPLILSWQSNHSELSKMTEHTEPFQKFFKQVTTAIRKKTQIFHIKRRPYMIHPSCSEPSCVPASQLFHVPEFVPWSYQFFSPVLVCIILPVPLGTSPHLDTPPKSSSLFRLSDSQTIPLIL